jgi:hypothetical protein
MAANNMTSGKAKKSGAPRKAPKVKAPNPKKPNFMRESDVIRKGSSAQTPMSKKRLSK